MVRWTKMRKLSANEIEKWITLDNGVHVPIKKGETVQDAIKRLSTFTPQNKSMEFEISSDYVHTKMLPGQSLKNGTVPKEVVKSVTTTLYDLNKKFSEVAQFIKDSECELREEARTNNDGTPDAESILVTRLDTSEEMGLRTDALFMNENHPCLSSLSALSDKVKESVTNGIYMPCAPAHYTDYPVAHEYGHIVQAYLLKNTKNWYDIDIKDDKDHTNLNSTFNSSSYKMYNQLVNAGIKNGYFKDDNEFMLHLSRYALVSIANDDYSEVFAECFANTMCGNVNVCGKAMRAFLKEEGLL